MSEFSVVAGNEGYGACDDAVTDGHAGYNQVTGAVRCGCWAHMRRK